MAALFGLSTPIPGFWVGLLSAEAGEAMDGTMVADLEPPATVVTDNPDGTTTSAASGYGRVWVPLGSGSWALDSDTVTNTGDLPFPVPTADWGPIDHWALLDSAALGELYCWSELPEPTYISAAWQLVIPAGALVLAFSSLDTTFTET